MEKNQTSIVDINKLVKKLNAASCDFWYKDENKKRYGHTIERVVEEILDCIVLDDFGSWGRQSHEFIIGAIDLLKDKALVGHSHKPYKLVLKTNKKNEKQIAFLKEIRDLIKNYKPHLKPIDIFRTFDTISKTLDSI